MRKGAKSEPISSFPLLPLSSPLSPAPQRSVPADPLSPPPVARAGDRERGGEEREREKGERRDAREVAVEGGLAVGVAVKGRRALDRVVAGGGACDVRTAHERKREEERRQAGHGGGRGEEREKEREREKREKARVGETAAFAQSLRKKCRETRSAEASRRIAPAPRRAQCGCSACARACGCAPAGGGRRRERGRKTGRKGEDHPTLANKGASPAIAIAPLISPLSRCYRVLRPRGCAVSTQARRIGSALFCARLCLDRRRKGEEKRGREG